MGNGKGGDVGFDGYLSPPPPLPIFMQAQSNSAALFV